MFKVYETYGVPLEMILDVFEERDLVIDWIEFFESSLKCNWNIKTTLSKIEVSLLDTKGKYHSKKVISLLKFYISNRG